MGNIYAELGVRPIVNALSTYTRLGGSLMPPEVTAAMAEAARHFVDLAELQQAVGRRIAELTHNEAAYVSSGAAAGLVIATAVCVAGADPAAIRQLPDLTGLKNEVVVHKSHRNGYDHAVRSVGVKLVEIGSALHTARWEMEAAITERTALAFWTQAGMTGTGDLPLETFIEVAHARGVPVLIDAAAQLPPVENLWRFTQMGADLVVFSGGKDLHGPQSSGLILGRKDLIAACALHGNPNGGICRPMKVGKEEMVGILAAVQWYLGLDHEGRAARHEQMVAEWCAALNQIPGVRAERSFPNGAGQPVPRAHVTLDAAHVGLNAEEVVERLLNGEPSIAVVPDGRDSFYLNPYTLHEGEEQIVLRQVRAMLAARQPV
ncbi:MAG: aminotransferase class V-fold PLP-dependent enzyme [Caldilineaceae bacterium]|nr:aminotransferase class V-fold PLP-dependent enzyme [Caldilineaceae bacterium]